MADPVGLANAQAREQEAADAEAEARMLAVWRDAYAAAAASLAVLLAQVARARRQGVTVDRTWVRRVSRLEDVVATVRQALRGYAQVAATATAARQVEAARAGVTYALDLVADTLDQVPPTRLALTTPTNVETLAGRMADGTPVADHFRATIADDAADAIRDAVERSLVDGVNPQTVARDLAEDMALSHTRAVTIMRTEVLGVLRETSRQTYDANPDVVRGWTWVSALDRRTCPACAVMHGTQHPTTETLDGHPRCRCAMAPLTATYASLGFAGLTDPPPIPLGTDWIMAMDPATRRAFLGPGKYAALEAGEIRLEDLVARREDPRWGTMRTERSLKSIREGRNANYGGLVAAS